jgi:hypothetical protein
MNDKGFLPYPSEKPTHLRYYNGIGWEEMRAPLPKENLGDSRYSKRKEKIRERVLNYNQFEENDAKITIIENLLDANKISESNSLEFEEKSKREEEKKQIKLENKDSIHLIIGNKSGRLVASALSIFIITIMLAGLSLATTVITDLEGRNAVWGIESFEKNVERYIDKKEKRFVIPKDTKNFKVEGEEGWHESCEYIINGVNLRISKYKEKIEKLESSTLKDRLIVMNEIREEALKIQSTLIEANVIKKEDNTSSNSDTLLPLRENWVGVAYFSHVTSESKEITLLEFIDAVNATTLTLVPGGAHDLIVRSCLRQLQEDNLR